MAGGDKDGKTEKPTPKRLAEARKEGRIPKSPELVSWASIYIGFAMLERTVGKGAAFLQNEMTEAGKLMAAPDQGTALKFMGDSVGQSLMIVLPLTITFMVLAIVGHFAQVRFVLAFKAVKPSFKKLNPITGAKRLFSMQSTVQAAKQLFKTVAIGVLIYMTLYKTVMGLTGNGPYAISEIIHVVGKSVATFVKETALIGIVIGLFDYGYQRHKVMQGLKMSKHEIKEESRSQDLPPEVRGQIRRKQRQMSRNRMMAAIQQADVVIVNPVHIAVALQYDPEKGAPRVLAKGAGFVAEKIRDEANEHNIPLVQDIPLARTLHKNCEIGEEIPAALFQAVARVLAFVFSLRARGTSQGFHKMPGTPELHEVEDIDEADLELVDA